MTEYYECKNCGALNPKDIGCLCGGAPGKPTRHGGRMRWFECECGHVSTRPVHCGFSVAQYGTQGEYRRSLLKYRDGPGCQGCGTDDDLTIDHKVPKSKGGKNHLSNLWLLCKSCNGEKGDLLVGEWLILKLRVAQ